MHIEKKKKNNHKLRKKKWKQNDVIISSTIYVKYRMDTIYVVCIYDTYTLSRIRCTIFFFFWYIFYSILLRQIVRAIPKMGMNASRKIESFKGLSEIIG